MRLDWNCRRPGAATLVELRLENDADGPRRVRVENRLDGPVRPPRRGGRPAAGWDEDGYQGVLDSDETRALGYACPAPPVDPPVVVREEPADGAEADRERSGAGAVVAALGDPRPPRDAVPTRTESAAEPGGERSLAGGQERGENPPAPTAPDGAVEGITPDGGAEATVDDEGEADVAPPTAVTDWLDDLTERVESDGLTPDEERALAFVGARVAKVQAALAERR